MKKDYESIFGNIVRLTLAKKIALLILCDTNVNDVTFIYKNNVKHNNLLEDYELTLADHINKIIIDKEELTFFIDCDYDEA